MSCGAGECQTTVPFLRYMLLDVILMMSWIVRISKWFGIVPQNGFIILLILDQSRHRVPYIESSMSYGLVNEKHAL